MYNKVNIFREEAEEESKGPCRWRDANGAVLFFCNKNCRRIPDSKRYSKFLNICLKYIYT